MAEFALPEPLYQLLEKIVTKLPWHTEDEMLATLHSLFEYRPWSARETDTARRVLVAPTAARNASPNLVADQAETNAKVDALTAQVQALVAAMSAGKGMAAPIAVPTGTGEVPGEGAISTDAPAQIKPIPSGDGTGPTPLAPPAGSPAAPVPVPAGTGDVAPAKAPPAPLA